MSDKGLVSRMHKNSETWAIEKNQTIQLEKKGKT